MAQSTSNTQKLTMEQGIGIGVVVGFVGALTLAAFVFCLARTRFAPAREPAQRPTPPPRNTIRVSDLDEEVVWVNTPNPQGVLKWKPNPAYKETKSLIIHMTPLSGGNQAIDNATLFSFDIDQLVRCSLEDRIWPNRLPRVPESDFDEDELVRLAGEPVNGGTWSESISNRKTRGAAIRCFLAQVIFKRMDPFCEIEETLLPPEIATAYQLLDPHAGVPLGENPSRGSIISRSNFPDTELSSNLKIGRDTLAVWREAVWILLRNVYDLSNTHAGHFQEGDPRKEKTHALAFRAMNALKLGTLRLPHEPDDVQKRMQHVFEAAAQSAMILFCQPSTWEFEWVSEKKGFMVFPAIRLVWDEDHVKGSKPAVLADFSRMQLQYLS